MVDDISTISSGISAQHPDDTFSSQPSITSPLLHSGLAQSNPSSVGSSAGSTNNQIENLTQRVLAQQAETAHALAILVERMDAQESKHQEEMNSLKQKIQAQHQEIALLKSIASERPQPGNTGARSPLQGEQSTVIRKMGNGKELSPTVVLRQKRGSVEYSIESMPPVDNKERKRSRPTTFHDFR